jgi:acetyl esterase/lipase
MLAATLFFVSLAATQPPAPQPIPLWDGKAPHAVGDTDRDKPNVTVYRAPADKANAAAVVVCPGGGYAGLAMDHEGKQVAEFFNELGVTAVVLKYRTANKERPGPLHPAPLTDAQRAIRLVRARASDFGIDTHRVGLMGFSAGGHLASTAGTHFDTGDPNAADPVDKQSCRPDFLILGYPVITMDDAVTHRGSRNNLIGTKPDPKLVEELSNEKRVTKETPPTFIFHTSEDAAVVPENAVRFYLACKKAGVPVELHMYEKGRHGVGINPKGVSVGTDAWKHRLADWLKDRGVLEQKK